MGRREVRRRARKLRTSVVVKTPALFSRDDGRRRK
jgi:hypothetical protein